MIYSNKKSYFFCVMVFLMLGVPSYGQGDGRIDAALDSYEVICDRCILLKERSLRGESIQPEELKSLLEQVSGLRATLQKGSRNMSPSQKERFERIRRRYSAAFSGQASPTDGPILKVARPVLDLPRVESGKKILRSAFGSAQNDISVFQNNNSGAQKDKGGALNDKGGAQKDNSGIQNGRVRSTGLLVLGGWRPGVTSYGAMAKITGRKAGVYIKGRSNFKGQIKPDYSCLSDGTSNGSPIWTTGKESRADWSLGAGGIFRITGPLSLYAGSGYGLCETFWEDASGKWARVDDYSAKGISADAGIIFTLNHFQASAGVSAISLKKAVLEIGLGISF